MGASAYFLLHKLHKPSCRVRIQGRPDLQGCGHGWRGFQSELGFDTQPIHRQSFPFLALDSMRHHERRAVSGCRWNPPQASETSTVSNRSELDVILTLLFWADKGNWLMEWQNEGRALSLEIVCHPITNAPSGIGWHGTWKMPCGEGAFCMDSTTLQADGAGEPPQADKTRSSPAATAEPQKTAAKPPSGTDAPGAIANPAKPGEDDKEPATPATSTTKAADAPKPTEPTKPTEKKPEPTTTPQTSAPTTLQTSVLPTTTSPPPLDPLARRPVELWRRHSSPTNALAQAQNGVAPPQSGGFPIGATIGIAVAGGVGALALIVTSIVLLRRHWRRRREGDDEQLKQLDTMYEQGKPTGSESMPGEKERWQRGLEQYHNGGAADNFTTANAYRS
ncbi:hypothetical protein PG988_014747 [Apiospora saccharicola]